ncbi:MauE/DoxX family redox-associated membrane protein [Chryseobacterium defluvii]|uniref:DoxX protein n=1 Tax=Chryseobacterium defluvii TaxID=160396 RepID=A0A495SN68_9FLAO|nr:MauE/DoxX family redox-associated membrane protein [Chryseobacterium defluvii]RKT01759.1 DoxX protein [Chryseobacterium defluvii]
MKAKNIFVEIVVFLQIILFIYTGVSKFLDFDNFTIDLNRQPFPHSITTVLEWMLPTSEITISLMLCINQTRRLGLLFSLTLMGLFTTYTALVLFNVFDQVPCSCGGIIKNLSWSQHLLFNLFIVSITFIALIQKEKPNEKLSLNL